MLFVYMYIYRRHFLRASFPGISYNLSDNHFSMLFNVTGTFRMNGVIVSATTIYASERRREREHLTVGARAIVT